MSSKNYNLKKKSILKKVSKYDKNKFLLSSFLFKRKKRSSLKPKKKSVKINTRKNVTRFIPSRKMSKKLQKDEPLFIFPIKKKSSLKKTNQIHLYRSNDGIHKFVVKVDGKIVRFGAKGYSDYTIHQDKERKARYISRHRSREDWKKSGIKTAGFWSYWLLWNQKTIDSSIRDIENKFKINIIKHF